MKVCSNCKIPKEESEFSWARKSQGTLQSKCKSCCAKYAHDKRAKDPEYMRNWREENSLEIAEYNRQWALRNPDYFSEYRLSNKEREANRKREWKRLNPLKVRQYNHNRRASLKNAPGSYEISDIELIFNLQDGLCAYCQCELGEDMHLDHIHPISRGGSNYPQNLCWSCPSCNESKNDKMLYEWTNRPYIRGKE